MDGNGGLILSPKSLLQHIQTLTKAKILWVAFSGGLDSHVLLNLLVRATQNISKNTLNVSEITSNPLDFNSDFKIGALHIHHGISQFADAWVQHCERICSQYAVPFKVLYVDGRVTDGRSPEAAAREARFSAFEAFLEQNHALLLAHHESDQAETILLRLFRGSGPLGLGGIREKAVLGKGELIRPLLNIPKAAVVAYAIAQNLCWIEDDSNMDTRFDRNFLRKEIMPLLNARWPHTVRSINRAGDLCLEAAMLVETIAAQDLEGVKGARTDALSVSGLLALPRVRRQGVIRYWLQQLGYAAPSRDHMDRIDKEVLKAKAGAKPRLKISMYEISRYRNDLMVSDLDSVRIV